MQKRWLLVFFVLFTLPALPFTDAKVYTDEPAVCGNGVCQGGQGELTSCPEDCEGQTCSPGKDCLVDPCTIPANPVAGYCVYPPGQPSGTCQFQLDISCTLCLNDGVKKWYGAWGDYACRLGGFTTGSSCVSNLAPPSVADFTVNSCDGTENCCASGQSSCIGNDQCGQWNEATKQITDKDGNAYAGGTAGFCREKCTAAEVGSCRFVAGTGQKCVSCSYRPDELWKKDFPAASVWSSTYVSSGVWVDDTSCVEPPPLPACTSGNGGCLSNVVNAATKPGACAVALQCGDCDAGYYFDAASSTCKPTCTTLRNTAAGGCTSTFTATDSSDLGKADCNAVATDKCVSCKGGYVWDGTKCVLGCKQEGLVCGGTSGSCCATTRIPPLEMYCSKASKAAVSGNCCPKGWYWDSITGQCVQAQICKLQCPNPKSPLNLGLPKDDSSLYWYTPGCFFDFNPGKPHEQACLTTDTFGLLDKFYLDVKVLDVNGNIVSSTVG